MESSRKGQFPVYYKGKWERSFFRCLYLLGAGVSREERDAPWEKLPAGSRGKAAGKQKGGTARDRIAARYRVGRGIWRPLWDLCGAHGGACPGLWRKGWACVWLGKCPGSAALWRNRLASSGDSPALAPGKYSRVRPARRRFAVGSGNRPPSLPLRRAFLGERRAKIWQLLFGRFAAGAHQPQHAGYSKRGRCRPSHGAGFGCRSAGLDRRRRVDWHDGVARRPVPVCWPCQMEGEPISYGTG